MQSLRSSRPTGHDHYRNARQSDSQIQHAQLDNWAIDLRHRLPTAERFSASGGYGMSARRGWPYWALMLAARITLPHFSVSSATSFPNSAGVIGMSSPPSSARRACNFGSANTAFTA